MKIISSKLHILCDTGQVDHRHLSERSKFTSALSASCLYFQDPLLLSQLPHTSHYVPLTKKPGFSQPERALFAQSINNRRALRAKHSDFDQAFLSLHLPPRLPHQNYKLSFTPFTFCTFDFVVIFDLGRAILAILTSG